MTLRPELLEDHFRIETLLTELTNAADGADRSTISQIWDECESSLLRHLEAEERCLFPEFEAEHPEACRALRSEHDEFRRRLTELGLAVDLHTIDKTRIHAFVVALREHAAREDETLYRWAEDEIAEPAHRGLLDFMDAGQLKRPRSRPGDAASRA